jgi:hypothetical protein
MEAPPQNLQKLTNILKLLGTYDDTANNSTRGLLDAAINNLKDETDIISKVIVLYAYALTDTTERTNLEIVNGIEDLKKKNFENNNIAKLICHSIYMSLQLKANAHNLLASTVSTDENALLSEDKLTKELDEFKEEYSFVVPEAPAPDAAPDAAPAAEAEAEVAPAPEAPEPAPEVEAPEPAPAPEVEAAPEVAPEVEAEAATPNKNANATPGNANTTPGNANATPGNANATPNKNANAKTNATPANATANATQKGGSKKSSKLRKTKKASRPSRA